MKRILGCFGVILVGLLIVSSADAATLKRMIDVRNEEKRMII
jgi:hypothetical protein